MKASELQPGQFFDWDDERWLCVRVTDIRCIAVDIDGHDYSIGLTDNVTLAVTGWDDEPQSDKPSPQVLMDYIAQRFPALLSPVIEQWMKENHVADAGKMVETLQLREGAYYRTAKGKVFGPMTAFGASRDLWHVETIDGLLWRSDGTETEGDTDDLIAEAPSVAKPEPEQFAAGDWLYCTESHAPLVAGKVYKVLAVKRDGWPEVEKDCGYWNPKYFRRATTDEIVKQQRKDYWQHPVIAANKPDADGWIEWHRNRCPVDPSLLVQVVWREDSSESKVYIAREIDWSAITHYRLVNPPTPELTWTVTT